MEENQLIRTDKFMYKLKRFFRMLFMKKGSQLYEMPSEDNLKEIQTELNKIISCKTEAEEMQIKKQLAVKLMKNELPIKNLSEDEIDNMISYFENDILEKTKELNSIKNEIIQLKKESK